MKIKVYNNNKIQDEKRYLEALTDEEVEENEEIIINVDDFKQIVIEDEFIDIEELLEQFKDTEVYIIPHDATNEEFVLDDKIQHVHFYIKTDLHNNKLYSIFNKIKKIDKQTFIQQLNNLNKIKMKFTNNNKLKQKKRMNMKKVLLHYQSFSKFDEIPNFNGAVIVKDDGKEVALGDRKSGFSKNELENLKNNTSERVPLYIKYILTIADNITTEERKQFEEELKNKFGNKVKIDNNNPNQIVFTMQNFDIENNILKIQKITNTHLQVLEFLNKNNITVINMNEKKDYIFKNSKYLDEDVKNKNKYITKPFMRTIEDYIKKEKQQTKEVKKEQVETIKKINLEELDDEELKKQVEELEKEIDTINNLKNIDNNIKQQLLKDLETKRTNTYNLYLQKVKQKLESEKENLLKQVKENKEKITELTTENEKINNELKEIENEANELINVFDNNFENIEQLKQALNQKANKFNNFVDKVNKLIDNFNNKINELNKQNEKLATELKQKEEVLKTKEEELNKLNKEKEQLQNEKIRLENSIKQKNEEIDEKNKQIEQHNKKVEYIKNMDNKVKEILSNKNLNAEQKLEELEKLQKENKEKVISNMLNVIILTIKKDIELNNNIKQLNSNIKQIEKDKNNEIDKLKDDLQQKDKNLEQKDKKIEELEETTKELKEMLERAKEVIKILFDTTEQVNLTKEQKETIKNIKQTISKSFKLK